MLYIILSLGEDYTFIVISYNNNLLLFITY